MIKSSSIFHQKFLRLLDFIFVSRPIILIPLWIFLFLGFYRGAQNQGIAINGFLMLFKGEFAFNTNGINGFLPVPIFYITFIYTILMGGVYILNQIYDLETDKINDKIYFLPRGILTVHQATIEMLILFLLVSLMSSVLKWSIFLLIALSLLLGILYSAKPFKFKGRPFIDLLSNSLGYGFLAFSIGWLTIAPYYSKIYLYSLPYILSIAAVYINITIVDFEGDKASGDCTIVVFLGKKISSWLSVIIIIITFIISYYLVDYPILLVSGVVLPFFINAAIKQKRKDFLFSSQIAPLLLGILIALIIPFLFLLFGIVFLATRWYYRRRFNIIYPLLGKDSKKVDSRK